MKKTHMAVLLALGALAAAPLAEATHQSNHDPGSKSKKCKKPTRKKAFVVKGELAQPLTVNTSEVNSITVTGANRHARNSGEIVDQNLTKNGVQVKGAPYIVNAATDDPLGFNLKRSGYEGSEAPKAGDKVRIKGKIELTKKKCVQPPGATLTLADRYGEPDVKKVRLIDKD